jgi:hypothetical protein
MALHRCGLWIALLFVLGCDSAISVPEHPTYAEDARQVLTSRCAICHVGPRRAGDTTGIPGYFRLDAWPSVGPDGLPTAPEAGSAACGTVDGVVCGAREMKDHIAVRIDDADAPMPPSGPLPEAERELLRRWIADGAPLGPPGQAPAVTMVAPTADVVVDQSIELSYVVSDADADAVAVAIGWSRDDGASGTFPGLAPVGAETIVLDTSQLPTGAYRLALTGWDAAGTTSRVDSEARLVVPARNVAPLVAVSQPNGGESLRASSYPDGFPIQWTASDAEGDALGFSVEWLHDGTQTTVCSAITANECLWDLAAVPPGTDYRIRVVASDGSNTTSDESDAPFTVSDGEVSFAGEVMPIFVAHCGGAACHGGANPQKGLALTSAAAAYTGLVGVASQECPATKRVDPGSSSTSYLSWKLAGSGPCFSGSRMPKSGSLAASDLATIDAWIAAGAPQN